MHELSVVFTVVEYVEKAAKESKANHVQSVTLEIGEVSMVIPSQLEDCFKWVCKKHEMLTGCELHIETIPAVTHCANCGKDYPTVEYGKKCPYCESDNTYLLRGNEFLIKEILVS